jgi:hypothetical protein
MNDENKNENIFLIKKVSLEKFHSKKGYYYSTPNDCKMENIIKERK